MSEVSSTVKNVTNVLEYLEASAERFPDKLAYVDMEGSYTFSEILDVSKRVGSFLADRVRKGTPVAVYMEKSIQQIAVFFGVAYAGAFYSPLDVQMPAQRVKLILDTLETTCMVVDRKTAQQAREIGFSGELLLFDEISAAPVREEILRTIRRGAIDADPLYAIFTSGSTGVPKGVLTSQRSAVNFTEWYCAAFDFSEEEVFGNQTPFYFDASVKDIYATIKTGATMYIVPKSLFSFPIKLIQFLNDRKINCIDWVPSALCIIVNFKTFEKVKPAYLKKVMFLGEVMPTKQFNMWRRALPDIQYANLYGPTEATGDCTYYKVERELLDTEPIPIGYACENSDVLILNEQNQPVGPDEVGEICVRGVSLALGYYNNPEKTDAAFVQNPLQKHYRELLYRTGDLGKYNQYGEILYVARKDFQIKHMGHRIELGEIETALSSVGGIRRVCCLYDQTTEKIVAVYEGDVDRTAIIDAIKNAIPKYMIPNIYHQVETMPTNMNGKIDRVQLKEAYAHG